MKFINRIFQTKLFLIILILMIIYSFFLAPTGFNRTISWNWIDKLNHDIKFFFPLILLFFTVCYGILSLFKKRTDKNLSIIHIILIILTITQIKLHNDYFFFILSVISFVTLLVNIILSLRKKND